MNRKIRLLDRQGGLQKSYRCPERRRDGLPGTKDDTGSPTQRKDIPSGGDHCRDAGGGYHDSLLPDVEPDGTRTAGDATWNALRAGDQEFEQDRKLIIV